MQLDATSLTDLLDHGFDSLIDVRSPSEFAEDHIPGAVSLPVLDDAERARVGTIYTQENPFRARKIGAALVARNAAAHVEGPLAEMDGAWRPLVYCWRGGQRSGSFATILAQIGWRVGVVSGGYRTWRRLVVAALYDTPWPLRTFILDGNTGTAKTALLALLQDRGVQVIDLEGLAAHRGSVLGPVGRPQPSQKGFETAIAARLARLDLSRPVVVEAESSKVGNLLVPPGLWAAMRVAPRLVIEAPVTERAAYLARAYDDVTGDPERLCDLLAKLRPYHGRERIRSWQAMARTGAHEPLAAELIEMHYDPRYAQSRARREGAVEEVLRTDTLDEEGLDRLADGIVARLNAG